MLRWFEQNGPEGDVVISSRVRLARNLKDYNFSLKLDTPDAHKMIGEAAQKLRVLPEFKDFHEYHFENLEEVQREAMKERHVISPFLLSQSVAGGFVSSNEDLSIMLNEEDHIRIQAYRAGMDMERAYEAADHIDDCIGAVLPYAYDTQYGYLTTCPSNVGTGMRVSYMCHLPALAWNNKIQGIAAEIGRFGLVMHSVYSDGNKSAGDIYQISNQITLGVTEKELIENITNIVQQIVTQERILRNRLKEKQKISVLDGIYRSYGILKYARKVSLKDGLVLLSQLRLGLAEGLVKTPDERDYAIYQLMIGIQPGNLEMLASQELEPVYAKVDGKLHLKKHTAYKVFEIIRTTAIVCVLQMLDYHRNIADAFRQFISMFTTANYASVFGSGMFNIGLSLPDYILLLAGVIIMYIVSFAGREESVRERLSKKSFALRFTIFLALFLGIAVFGVYGIGYESSQFIYNQF